MILYEQLRFYMNYYEMSISNKKKCYPVAEVRLVEPMRPLKTRVSLSLDEEVVKKLRVLAEEDDRQLSSYINLVLRNYLRNLEKK